MVMGVGFDTRCKW